MVQKAKRTKTSIDRLKDLQDHTSTLYAMNRLRQSPVTSGTGSLPGLGGSPAGSTAAAGNFLRTDGDTMVGPIAYYPVTVLINASDELDISPTPATPQSSSYVIASFSSPDTLQLIKGAAYAGQQLWLQVPASSTLTVEDYSSNATGNIVTSDGSDVVITTTTDPVTFTLIFDVTLSPNSNEGGWVIMSARAISGASASPSDTAGAIVCEDVVPCDMTATGFNSLAPTSLENGYDEDFNSSATQGNATIASSDAQYVWDLENGRFVEIFHVHVKVNYSLGFSAASGEWTGKYEYWDGSTWTAFDTWTLDSTMAQDRIFDGDVSATTSKIRCRFTPTGAGNEIITFAYELNYDVVKKPCEILTFPVRPTNSDLGAGATEDIDLGQTDGRLSHVFTKTLTADTAFTFTKPPCEDKTQVFIVEITQDGTGGWEADFTTNNTINGTVPSVDSNADTKTLLTGTTLDGGATYWLFRTGNSTTTATDDFASKELDNLGTTSLNADLNMNSNKLNFNNDAIGLSWTNALADGFLELKVDSADFFDFTESNNGPVSLKIRSQHAADPDNTMTITQLSGSTGVGQFFAPNEMQFLGSGSSDVFNYDQNRIETNVNILPDADGTLSIGAVATRYLDMYSAGYKFDINRGLNFNTGGGNITVNGSSDTFTITVDSVLKQTMSSTLTTLAGNVDVLGVAGIGDKAEFTEITAPITDPGANSGWMYAKDVGGVTQPFWEDEAGTVTNMIGGAGGSVNQISQGDTSITITDTGTGAIVGKVDNVQKFNISPTSINFDDDVVLGVLSTDDITFNGRVDSDIIPKTDNSEDLGSSSLEFKDLYIDGIADIDRLENNGSSIAVGDDLEFDFGDTVAFNESQSSVGSAGFATALPANPTGYLVVKQGSTEVVVPYYDKT